MNQGSHREQISAIEFVMIAFIFFFSVPVIQATIDVEHPTGMAATVVVAVVSKLAWMWYYRNVPRPGKTIKTSTETAFNTRVNKMEAHLEDLFAIVKDTENYKAS